MPANIAFYVHHHGSGHLMRCLAISKKLSAECRVTFLGSSLGQYQNIIPNQVSCIYLPMDVPIETDEHYIADTDLIGLHYAPLNVEGQMERVRQMVDFFASTPSLLLIVDVSTEVAMLARLCGVPTIIMRQHGCRSDIAHQIAYRNAALLIAPYPALLKQADPRWLDQKTFYTGGYSRFDRAPLDESDVTVYPDHAAILIGSGGTSINVHFISHLVQKCPSWYFSVIGQIDEGLLERQPPNVKFCGHLAEPLTILKQSSVLIGNTGHNTVMEAASLGKAFVTIPEFRPFNEQVVKAGLLGELDLATVINPEKLYTTDWPLVLRAATENITNWQNIIDDNALSLAAGKIQDIYQTYFKSPTA